MVRSMERLRKKVCKWAFAVMVAALSMVMFSACLKDSGNEGYPVAAVRALNAVPGSELLDIGLDQNKLNFDQVSWRAEDFAYGDTLPYKNAWPGNRLVRVFEAGSPQGTQPLARQTVTFTPGRFYSLYVVGQDDDMEILSIEDDLTAPGQGKAKLRFIHLSPDAPSLDFGVHGADTLIASDKSFKEIEAFSLIDAGEIYTFDIIGHSSGDVLHSFDFEPKNGMIYTIWAKGLTADGADPAVAFGHGILTH
ncbi:protein of unknown function [Parapedobacter composti]|uniref:DUF4397 domain-containing protein n=2 Tax=Parapedobacter composti TaxID=623281 RepID=A0A1I1F5T9_9SPHI|nr:protein of unknown function [Parapedobacter composti]